MCLQSSPVITAYAPAGLQSVTHDMGLKSVHMSDLFIFSLVSVARCLPAAVSVWIRTKG